jgi:PPE-repeat protein
MDYAFAPPEINSARMYAGPGSGSFLAAAGSWDALSAELATTAEGYESVLSNLTSFQWRGVASEAMAAAAAHYMGWLQTAAEQTKQTAIQVRAAASAYEHAHATTVPPTAVAANRARLASLIATNVVGQNTAAIAATEAQYSDYWAQDTAAMSGYHASSAAATQLPRISSPSKSTNEAGLTAQNAAISQANALAAQSNSVSQALPKADLPTFSINDAEFGLLDVISATGTSISSPTLLEQMVTGAIGAEANLGILPKLAAPAAIAPLAALPELAGATSSMSGGAGLGNITATLTRAGSIGPMSVPATWSAPSIPKAFSPLEPAGMTTIPGTDGAVASGYPGYPGMPAGATSRGASGPPRYGTRLTVMTRPPAAG